MRVRTMAAAAALAGLTLTVVGCCGSPARGSTTLTAPPSPAPEPEQPPAPPPPPPPTDLASVNWGAHTYLIDDQRYQLRGGEWEMHEYLLDEWKGAHDTEIFRFQSVTMTDLDGDGAAEAVVLLWHMYTGPSGPRHESLYLVTFGWQDGVPVQLDATGAGNVRISAVVASAGGEISVVHEHPVPPFMTTRWRWTAGRLTPLK